MEYNKVIDWYVSKQVASFEGPNRPRFIKILKERPGFFESQIRRNFEDIFIFAALDLNEVIVCDPSTIDDFCKDTVNALQEHYLPKEKSEVVVK